MSKTSKVFFLGGFLFLLFLAAEKIYVLISYNGDIKEESKVNIDLNNRAFKYGDAVFESIKYAYGKLVFWEDHYFRLMSSMRILRMEIPLSFSPEYLEEKILETINANDLEQSACRLRFTVFRKGTGLYLPETNQVDFVISVEKLNSEKYILNSEGLQIDLFKDHYKQVGLLSNLKTANSLIYVLAAIYKQENKLDDCILINDQKEVVEAVSSNVFMVKENVIYTPPLSSGCLKGIMRKNVIKLAKNKGIELKEEAFSPFELQRAEEVFLTNSVSGIKWVSNYRKKKYTKNVASSLIDSLNLFVKLS